jgi:hypothetical protein
MSEWISVKDAKVPDDGGSYLVANVELGIVAPYVQCVIKSNPWTANHNWSYGTEITHWMPLPEPPEDKK